MVLAGLKTYLLGVYKEPDVTMTQLTLAKSS